MQHIDSIRPEPVAAAKVWCIADFCSQHQLDAKEKASLTALFGEFATTSELAHNVTRRSRSR